MGTGLPDVSATDNESDISAVPKTAIESAAVPRVSEDSEEVTVSADTASLVCEDVLLPPEAGEDVMAPEEDDAPGTDDAPDTGEPVEGPPDVLPAPDAVLSPDAFGARGSTSADSCLSLADATTALSTSHIRIV